MAERIYYVEVPPATVAKRRTLESLRDAIARDLNITLPVRIRYYRQANGVYEQGVAALGQLDLDLLSAPTDLGGFLDSAQSLGITHTRHLNQVWLNIEAETDTRELCRTLAHELRHIAQWREHRSLTSEGKKAIDATYARNPGAFRERLEADARAYAADAIRRLDRRELEV